mgnify:CR=1 FL=1
MRTFTIITPLTISLYLAAHAAAERSWFDDDALAISAELRPIAPEPHPYTTEPGRVMLEFTPIDYAYDRRNPEGENRRSEAYNVGLLLKFGVRDNLDLQVGADVFSWSRERDRDAGERDISRGFGDLTVRAKLNLWGNDGGETAGAIMPFLILPTATGGVGDPGIRFGAMLPTLFEFADGWTFETTPSVAAVRNADNNGYEAEFTNLVVLSRELTPGLDLFTEFEAAITTEAGDRWTGVAGVGLTIELNSDTVLEPVFNFGINRAADDYAFSLAIVRRF